MLPRRHRLTRPEDYTAVLRPGSARPGARTSRAGSPVLVLHTTVAAEARPPRVGFVVSGAVGNAVVRHRVSRRLRHLMATRLDRVPAGTDLVVRATPSAATASSAELGRALDKVLGRVFA